MKQDIQCDSGNTRDKAVIAKALLRAGMHSPEDFISEAWRYRYIGFSLDDATPLALCEAALVLECGFRQQRSAAAVAFLRQLTSQDALLAQLPPGLRIWATTLLGFSLCQQVSPAQVYEGMQVFARSWVLIAQARQAGMLFELYEGLADLLAERFDRRAWKYAFGMHAISQVLDDPMLKSRCWLVQQLCRNRLARGASPPMATAPLDSMPQTDLQWIRCEVAEALALFDSNKPVRHGLVQLTRLEAWRQGFSYCYRVVSPLLNQCVALGDSYNAMRLALHVQERQLCAQPYKQAELHQSLLRCHSKSLRFVIGQLAGSGDAQWRWLPSHIGVPVLTVKEVERWLGAVDGQGAG